MSSIENARKGREVLSNPTNTLRQCLFSVAAFLLRAKAKCSATTFENNVALPDFDPRTLLFTRISKSASKRARIHGRARERYFSRSLFSAQYVLRVGIDVFECLCVDLLCGVCVDVVFVTCISISCLVCVWISCLVRVCADPASTRTGRGVRTCTSGAQAAPNWGVMRLQLAATEESHHCSSVVCHKSISAHRHSRAQMYSRHENNTEYSSQPFWSEYVLALSSVPC